MIPNAWDFDDCVLAIRAAAGEKLEWQRREKGKTPDEDTQETGEEEMEEEDESQEEEEETFGAEGSP